MEIRFFAHSWLSDWNHGNAHFLRGLASALVRRGHGVRVYEAWWGWSLAQLWTEVAGPRAVVQMRAAYPELDLRFYGDGAAAPRLGEGAITGLPWVESWGAELAGADIVIAHEWNPPELFALLAGQRRRHGFRLLLYDTHHRAVSAPEELRRLPLGALDGVLAFGESLRRLYERWGVQHSYTLHEAADLERFHSPAAVAAKHDIGWIGNWGDDERTRELDEFLLQPARALGLDGTVHGVRYPAAAQAHLEAAGLRYGGYLANLDAPAAYARARVAVHIPRRPYTAALAGIPTIRVFEALACGAALVCAPWHDAEGMFTPGEDYWLARDGAEMAQRIKQLLADPAQRRALGRRGAATIRARHTCAHRAQELEAICRDLD